MPGMRTSLFMVLAERSRNCCRFSPDLIMICMDGIEKAGDVEEDGSSVSLLRGKRMVRAAFVAAFSNCAVSAPVHKEVKLCAPVEESLPVSPGLRVRVHR